MADQGKGTRASLSKARLNRDTMEKENQQHIDIDVDGLEPSPETYAAIMATNKPDPRGPGYIRLYLLAGSLFLCSTLNGQQIYDGSKIYC